MRRRAWLHVRLATVALHRGMAVITECMFQRRLTAFFSLGLLVLPHLPAAAQPLPKARLRAAFADLALDRPVWMCQAPDGSGRFFVVEQPGRILIVRRGGDAG